MTPPKSAALRVRCKECGWLVFRARLCSQCYRPLLDWKEPYPPAKHGSNAVTHWRVERHGGLKHNVWRVLRVFDDEDRARACYRKESKKVKRGGVRLVRFTVHLRTAEYLERPLEIVSTWIGRHFLDTEGVL